MPQVSCYLAAASLSSFQFLNLVRYSLPLFVWLFCFSFFLRFFKVQVVFLSLLPARSISQQATSAWSMPSTYLTWSQKILLAITSLSLQMNFFSLPFTEKPLSTAAWPCERTNNIPQLAVHVFASHDLMHQDIHSGLDLVKIHKTVSFFVNHGSCILRVLEQSPV